MAEANNITIDRPEIIWHEIVKAKRILLHCHPSPDGDSIGSSLAMAHALRQKGKEVTVIKGDSSLPGYLSKLPGFETITKNNFFEINLTDFDLFLILDSGSPNQISKFKEIVFPLPIRTVVIDHHRSNIGFADINLVDLNYPATAQIVYDLFKKWGISITREIALCLFVGMYTDTGGFKYRPTSAKTLMAAAQLAEIAPDYPDLLFSLENSNTKGSLILEGLLLTSIETFFSDSVALASISNEDLKKHTISEQDLGGVNIANTLKSVIGWNIGISFIEIEPNVVKLSFRTRDVEKYDASKLATVLGGGGHSGAAGAQLKGSISDAKQQVLAVLKQVFADLA